MTTDEAQSELNALMGLAKSGEDLKSHKQRIRQLYTEVVRKPLRECNCRDVLSDALMEIYNKLKHLKLKSLDMPKARLLNGVVLQIGGRHYTNANLTDEVAREFLANFPMRKDWFAELPSATTSKAVVAEVDKTPENVAEVAPTAIKSANKPTTPKKKKTAKKAK